MPGKTGLTSVAVMSEPLRSVLSNTNLLKK